MIWDDVVRSLICGVTVWYGMVWYGMVWYGMVWYGMVWYGWLFTVWCDIVCNMVLIYLILHTVFSQIFRGNAIEIEPIHSFRGHRYVCLCLCVVATFSFMIFPATFVFVWLLMFVRL